MNLDAFARRSYVVLLDKWTQESYVSCSLCEKQRVQTPYMHAFKFTDVKAAVQWQDSMVNRKAFNKKPFYHKCTHVKFDYDREMDYPLFVGDLIPIYTDEFYLPANKVFETQTINYLKPIPLPNEAFEEKKAIVL